MRIGLNVIAKNEAYFIQGLLTSTSELFDEIVVVDTGSSDSTASIARGVGARVVSHPTENLAEARNIGIDHADADWVLCLDADHRLVPEDLRRLRAHVAVTTADCLLLPIYNYMGDGRWSEFESYRAVRTASRVRWTGNFHESLYQDIRRYDASVEAVHTPIRHFEYLGTTDFLAKRHRNIDRLRSAVEEPDADAKIVALASLDYFAIGEFDRAVELATRASLVAPDEPLAFQFLGQYELARGSADTARTWLLRALDLTPDNDPDYGQVQLALAQADINDGALEQARQRIQAIRDARPSVAADLNHAVVSLLAGDTVRARAETLAALERETLFADPLVFRGRLNGSMYDSQVTLLAQYDELISTEWFMSIRRTAASLQREWGFGGGTA